MRVLFLSRSTLFTQPGGDTLQVEQTAAYLKKLGCEVDIKLSGQPLHFEKYNLVHFFNLIRPADARQVYRSKTPLIISSIYHDYSEFDAKHRGGMASIFFKFSGKFGLEYFKTVMRWLNGSDMFPGLSFILNGQRASARKLLKRASFLIATSHQEIGRIKNDLGFLPPSQKVSLGSDHIPQKTGQYQRSGVLCAARVEGPKNQLNLIRALKNTGIELTLSGQTAANQNAYLQQCKNEAGPMVNFAGRVPKEELLELYQKSKVHALLSYYETTGLSTVEALKLGCQAVVTDRGGQPEIFGNHAFYCDPDNPSSIRNAIGQALETKGNHSDWVKENFGWARSAQEILDIYQTVMAQTKT